MLVKIKTHDGIEYSATIEGFILDDFIADINTKPHEMIKFGGYGIVKSSIKFVDATGQTTAA